MQITFRRCAPSLALLLFALCFGTIDVRAAENFLPALGGSGGGQFIAACPATQSLTGFELRAGDDIDAIRPLCVTAYASGSVTAPILTDGSGLIIRYANLQAELAGAPYNKFVGDKLELPGDWHGGTGGGRASVICPKAKPIVVAMYVAAEGVQTISVNNIHLFCGQALPSQQLDENPTAIFDAPANSTTPGPLGIGGGTVSNRNGFQRCPEGQVAAGIHGRAGEWLDALGLICAEPRVSPAIALGRVPNTSPTEATPANLCAAAASARARNSPAAPGLEAQCNAAGGNTGLALGRVPAGDAANDAPISICDAAISARKRHSPAAPGLATQCRALGGGDALDRALFGPLGADGLASQGEALAAADPLLANLREAQPEGANRRGFDIGAAVCEHDSAWGPGKQDVLDALAPAEREGFKIAASYSLDRNRNAALAATGATIDLADAELNAARGVQSDARYSLGFDIASGLFGDPALGAKGNTAIGPGSLAVRNALGTAAQSGFDASMAIHFGRKY